MEKMKNKTSQEEARKQKLMLVFPLLITPFILISFWALGGGSNINMNELKDSTGFNLDLPIAENEKEVGDKLSMYEEAKRKLAKLNELKRADPYYSEDEFDDEGIFDEGYPESKSMRTLSFQDDKENQIYEKINQLNATLDQSKYHSTAPYSEPAYLPATETYQIKSDLSRLEEMMNRMQSTDSDPDPEMDQINTVLQSVLDIQHPERVQDRIKRTSLENLGQVFAVHSTREDLPVTYLHNKSSDVDQETEAIGFLGLDNNIQEVQNGIKAVVHETSTVIAGSTLKIRLLNDIYINGNLIPKDNFLFGKVSFQDERLSVNIDAVRYGNSIYPVKLSVVDIDGIEGIRMPSSVIRDVAKQGGDQLTSGLSMTSFSPNIGTQLASTGIDVGRSMLSKKVKAVKVQVKSGYKILLRDNKI